MKLKPNRTALYSLFAVFIVLLAYFFVGWPREHADVRYGITWSKPYAEELGLNSQQGLEVMLDEVNVRRFRIPAYWTLIEPEQGYFDFTWLDAQLDLIERYDGDVTLAVGARLPRWPECWVPEWTENLSQSDRESAQLNYVQKVYERYSEHPAIIKWQIENEVSFTFFAKCDGLTKQLVAEQLSLVRGLEQSRVKNIQRPVITTDSGEFSTWLAFVGKVDGKGVSLYRRVTNPWIGVINYWFIPPWAYQRKANLVSPFIGHIHISEFQMEPWASVPLHTLENSAMFFTLDHKQMERNLVYAQRTGFDEIYFWGAEWWLWMARERGIPDFLDTMTQFFEENR